MGGVDFTFDIIEKFVKKGVDIVTANKDLIAKKGADIFKLAKISGSKVLFEASVGGGIPIIKTLQDSLAGNEINHITGILNGTSNYIMTLMDSGISYEEALKDAQDKGFAESNPDADVKGFDASRKLSILINLAFRKKLDWTNISSAELASVPEDDFVKAKVLGYKIKYIAEAVNNNGSISAYVKPVFVAADSFFFAINNEYNGVKVKGNYVDEVTLIGKGAGSLPTGSAVYSDFKDLLNNYNYNRDLDVKEDISSKLWAEKADWIIIGKGIEIVKDKTEEEVINLGDRIYKILN